MHQLHELFAAKTLRVHVLERSRQEFLSWELLCLIATVLPLRQSQSQSLFWCLQLRDLDAAASVTSTCMSFLLSPPPWLWGTLSRVEPHSWQSHRAHSDTSVLTLRKVSGTFPVLSPTATTARARPAPQIYTPHHFVYPAVPELAIFNICMSARLFVNAISNVWALWGLTDFWRLVLLSMVYHGV